MNTFKNKSEQKKLQSDIVTFIKENSKLKGEYPKSGT